MRGRGRLHSSRQGLYAGRSRGGDGAGGHDYVVVAVVDGGTDPYGVGSEYPVRMLFWTALLVAGDPQPGEGPGEAVLVAESPGHHQPDGSSPGDGHHRDGSRVASVVVTVDGDGDLSYAWGFWVHAAVTLALSVRPLMRLVERTKSSPDRCVARAALWCSPRGLPAAAALCLRRFCGVPTGPSLTPAFLLVPIALMGSAVVREGLVDRVPLGRGEVFENLSGAVFVTDNLGRVVDVNAEARHLAKDIDGATEVMGRTLSHVAPQIARLLDRDGEVDLPGAQGDRMLSIVTSPIVDGRASSVGRCAIVRDVTSAAMQRRELERVRDALAEQVAVSEKLRVELGAQVVHDSATGVYNRRFLADALPGHRGVVRESRCGTEHRGIRY